MRARVLCGAFVALAANLAAQAPVTAPAAAPATAPSAPAGPNRAEFRVGGFMLSGERSYDYIGPKPAPATGSTRGIDVLLRASGIGVSVRSMSGTYGDGKLKIVSADARLLLFPPVFTIFGGYGKRALCGVSCRTNTIIMGGVSSTVSIGGSGLRTFISGAMLIAPELKSVAGTTTGASAAGSGIEAEAAILYRFPGAPLFVSLGYRTETFNIKATTSAPQAPEEVRGLRFGGGIQFGGR